MNAITSPHEQRVVSYADSLLEQVGNVPVIQDEEVAEKAADLLKLLKTAKKNLDEDRLSITRPIKDSVRQIEARYKPRTEAIVEAISEVNGKLSGYLLAKRRAEEEAERKLREEQRAAARAAEEAAAAAERAAAAAVESGGEEEASEAALEAERAAAEVRANAESVLNSVVVRKPTRGTLGSTASVVERPDFEVVDIRQVPAEFLMVDAVKVRRAIAGKDGRRDIPGLRVFTKTTVASR